LRIGPNRTAAIFQQRLRFALFGASPGVPAAAGCVRRPRRRRVCPAIRRPSRRPTTRSAHHYPARRPTARLCLTRPDSQPYPLQLATSAATPHAPPTLPRVRRPPLRSHAAKRTARKAYLFAAYIYLC